LRFSRTTFSALCNGEPAIASNQRVVHLKEINPMTFQRILLSVTLALSSMALPVIVNAQAPDNTTVNKRDRDPGQATADQQKENRSDRDLTKQIRQSIMADKSLSTYAHNVKIISQNGAVTLKGPVKSDDEKTAVIAKAVAVAGSTDKVTDQITVKH
jgi:hyperosmotically inducible protein